MNRLPYLIFAASIVTSGAFVRPLFADPPVNLQASTPGTAQTGHVNVAGTILTTNVGASDAGTSARAVSGSVTSSSGTTFGGVFQSASTSGRGVYGSADASSGSTFGGYFRTSSTSGVGVYGAASASTGTTYAGYFRVSSAFGYGVYAVAEEGAFGYGGTAIYGLASGTGTGGEFRATGELGTALSASALGSRGRAVHGYAMGSSSDATAGYFECKAGVGVYGSGETYGGRFESNGSGRSAIFADGNDQSDGLQAFTQSTSGAAVRGDAQASSGFTWGGVFQCASSSGYGVTGVASSTTGVTYGGKFSSASTSGYGVHATGHYGGYFASTGDGFNYGLMGTSDSNFGSGVYASATSPTGSTAGVRAFAQSTSGRALYASASSTTGATYGVYGRVDSLTDGYGVYCGGKLAASGTKSFRIDHPLDPKNMYLLHYCTEGPEPINAYRGTVVTDEAGSATVRLPDYFESINRDPTYQLTVIDEGDDFVLAKVSQGVVNGSFKIRTSKPNVKVCWRVEAVRNDLFVKRYGAPTEVNKPKGERGTYVHPELYGEPIERGLDFGQSKSRPANQKPVR